MKENPNATCYYELDLDLLERNELQSTRNPTVLSLIAEVRRLHNQKSVVWADEASPFTGEQVKALLDENERYRAVVDAAREYKRNCNSPWSIVVPTEADKAHVRNAITEVEYSAKLREHWDVKDALFAALAALDEKGTPLAGEDWKDIANGRDDVCSYCGYPKNSSLCQGQHP